MIWDKKQLSGNRTGKRILCVLMAVWFACAAIVTDYQETKAAELAGAAEAAESLQWIFTVLAGMGMSVSVKELLKPRQADIEKDIGKNIDWDNVDWGDLLDSPASQDQIKDTEDMINRLYGNASTKWKEMYEQSLSPTPTPDNPDPEPPVTVAPIDPDSVTPPDWNTLKKTALNKGFLALGAATYWCLKEAVKGFWDEVFEPEREMSNDRNPYSYSDLIGFISCESVINGKLWTAKAYVYKVNGELKKLRIDKLTDSDGNFFYYRMSQEDPFLASSTKCLGIYRVSNVGGISSWEDTSVGVSYTGYSGLTSQNCNFVCYMPYVFNGQSFDAAVKPYSKPAIWTNPDLKNDYDNNKSPSLPDTSPAPAIKIPSLDEIKELQKKGNDADDEKRPSIIQEFITNHYTNPTPAPEPTTAPDPEPTTAPDPEPNPSESPNPTTTPAVNPEISGAPKPSSAPQPSGTPEEDDAEVAVNKYKTDLRLVFPFCIPFDLIHLLNVFDAEPVAPVFTFPFDLSLKNPFKEGKMILDVHETFECDLSDFDSVIQIFRTTETIGFVIALMMVTRNLIRG